MGLSNSLMHFAFLPTRAFPRLPFSLVRRRIARVEQGLSMHDRNFPKHHTISQRTYVQIRLTRGRIDENDNLGRHEHSKNKLASIQQTNHTNPIFPHHNLLFLVK